MKKLFAVAVFLAIGGAAYATGPDTDNRTPVNVYGVKPDGTKAQLHLGDAGEALVSGSVTMQGTTPDGGTAAPRLDMDRRQVVAVGAMPGPALGANLTTTAGAGFTIPPGAEYLICALAAEVWLTFDGTTTATADAPSIPFFSRQCRIVGPFAAQVTTSGILPAGATVLAGSEVVAIPMTRPQ